MRGVDRPTTIEIENKMDENSKFWEDLRKQVEIGKSDFKGLRFPEDPSLKGFKGLTFKDEAQFQGATFEGVAYFSKAIFEKAAIFENTVFEKEVSFRNVVFKGHAIFRESKFKRHTDFVEATFGAHAVFAKTYIADGVFYDSRFKGVARFNGTQFENATFHRVVFEHDARFQGSKFNRRADFPGATFMRSATFEECVFGDRVDFRDARAVGTVTFPLPSRGKCEQPFRNPGQGETAYRFAGLSAKNSGDSTTASEYHFAERCVADTRKRRCWSEPAFSHLSKKARALLVSKGWLGFLLLRLPFGYGERPLRALVTCLMVIVLFAFGYWLGGGVIEEGTSELTLRDAAYFSVITFTTLGAGDYQLVGFSRLLCSSESFLGAFLIAAFVVVLGRRYIR